MWLFVVHVRDRPCTGEGVGLQFKWLRVDPLLTVILCRFGLSGCAVGIVCLGLQFLLALSPRDDPAALPAPVRAAVRGAADFNFYSLPCYAGCLSNFPLHLWSLWSRF
jgi:hypothetical protein